MSNLISCNLMGGLGNQLFQAAHAVAQGITHNRDVVFVPRSWTPLQGRQTENYVNNIFRNLKFVDNIDGFERIVEGPWEYSEVPVKGGNIVFDGYFQSSKNFSPHFDRIRNIFSPTDEFISEMLEKYPELKQENTVSLHIRKGDFLMNPDIHPSIGLSYVKRCFELLGETNHIFVFSDDKSWAKENLQMINSTFVDEEDYKELWLMSLCKNNIISNSSFSWWGSFLNKNPNKKVFAPSIWFGPRGPRNFVDIFQPEWTVINVEYKDGSLEYVA